MSFWSSFSILYLLCGIQYTYINFHSLLSVNNISLQVNCRKTLCSHIGPLSPLIDFYVITGIYIMFIYMETPSDNFLIFAFNHYMYFREFKWKNSVLYLLTHFYSFSFIPKNSCFLLVSFPFILKNFLYHFL